MALAQNFSILPRDAHDLAACKKADSDSAGLERSLHVCIRSFLISISFPSRLPELTTPQQSRLLVIVQMDLVLLDFLPLHHGCVVAFTLRRPLLYSSFIIQTVGPGWAAQLVGAPSRTPKGCWLDYRLVHIWEATNQGFSLSLMSLSLPLSLSKVNKHILG